MTPTFSLAFIDKNRILRLDVDKTFYIFCEFMETWEITQATIALIEGSWSIEDVIWNPFTSSEWFFNTILSSSIRLWGALIIFFIWLVALIWVIKDANARSDSFRFALLAALCVIIFSPIFWILLYIAIRPQWYKRDKTPRRDSILQQTQICENCWNMNLISHEYCTNCWESLHTTCHECREKYSKNYAYCPNCWAPRIEE